MRVARWLLICVLCGCSSLDDPPDDDQLASESARQCAHQHPIDGAAREQLVQQTGSVQECMQDDGPCQGNDCTGTVEGRDCDAGSLLGPAAAACIAEAAGLEQGLAGLSVRMTYHFGHRRIVWNVSNTLEDAGQDGMSGAFISVDAITGAVLEQGGWSATP